jgi:hypothetical protein
MTPAITYIARWASANSGSWNTAYGDASSRYAYAMADLGGTYHTTYNRVHRHFIHFKKPGTEEILMQFDDIDLSNAPNQVEVHIHYPQNGETAATLGGGETYNEGNTTCPGTGGCAGLDSARLIVSLEDGGATAQDPARNYGIVSRFFSPGSIVLRDDASNYPGSNGHTHRVSLCGGSACGATANQFEAVTVHKVTSSLTDTTLNAKTLSPDPNWAAMETMDASGSGGKVALFARNGRTPFLANIQTDLSGTGQYLIAGLQGGLVYRVHCNDNGTNVLEHAVASGDNTLYFEAPSGSYSIFPAGISNLILKAALPIVNVGASLNYYFQAEGTPPLFTWSIGSGTLPPGVGLNPSGVLSGTPSQAGDYTFTVTVEETSASTLQTSAAFTLHVAPPLVNVLVDAVTSNAAVVTYGGLGLNALQPCTLTVSPQPDFSAPVESITDSGGAADRTYVAGAAHALQPSTTYYLQGDCGSWSSQTVSFTTAAPASGSVSVAVSITPPAWLPVAFAQVQYGNSSHLGGTVTVPCSGGCTARIPVSAGALVYLKHLYLDASSKVLASSSSQPVVAGP